MASGPGLSLERAEAGRLVLRRRARQPDQGPPARGRDRVPRRRFRGVPGALRHQLLPTRPGHHANPGCASRRSTPRWPDWSGNTTGCGSCGRIPGSALSPTSAPGGPASTITPSMINKLARPYGRQLTLDDVTAARVPPTRAPRDSWRSRIGRSGSSGLGRDVPHTRGRDRHRRGRFGLELTSPIVATRRPGSRLMEYKGIGWKIADCVRLFSLDKQRAFPIDANIRGCLEDSLRKEGDHRVGRTRRALAWVAEHFGPNAGYAGQLLFLDQLGTA